MILSPDTAAVQYLCDQYGYNLYHASRSKILVYAGRVNTAKQIPRAPASAPPLLERRTYSPEKFDFRTSYSKFTKLPAGTFVILECSIQNYAYSLQNSEDNKPQILYNARAHTQTTFTLSIYPNAQAAYTSRRSTPPSTHTAKRNNSDT